MSLTQLVGIAGPARAGKDTLGRGLAHHAGFQCLSFAQPMRVFVASLIGMSVSDMDTVKEIPHPALGGKTPRFAMQTLGTEWGRETISQSLWLDAAMTRARKLVSDGTPVAITDVRLDAEARAILDEGGLVIRLSRPGFDLTGKAVAHATEQGIADALVSCDLVNNGSPDELIASALQALVMRPHALEA